MTIPDALLHVAVHLAGDDAGKLDRIFDAEQAPATDLPAAALAYAGAGVPIFPLVPGEKRPIVPRGLHEATTDPAQVQAWWARWPTANIGMATGHVYDCIDVDVDHHADPPKPNGYLALADLRETGALPEVLGRALTPRGGAHLYVAVSGRGNKAGLLPGIDYRGLGGYTVLPPSFSAEHQRRWTWSFPLGALA